MDYSDAETTREGLTSDGFSKDEHSKTAFVTPVHGVTPKEISSEEVNARLDALPCAWNTGEELGGGTIVPWNQIHDGSVYQSAEFIEGKYYPMLAFVIRLQGVQSGFITSDGEQFLEMIKLPVEDLRNDASTFAAYLIKKEYLLCEMARKERADLDDIKDHVKVEYPSDMIGMRKYFGYRGDGTCSHAHLAGIKRFSHGEGKRDVNGEFKRKKVRCDNLHMRYIEKTESWEICHCLSGGSNAQQQHGDHGTPLSDSSPSVFQMVTGAVAPRITGSAGSSTRPIEVGHDEESEECLTCRCIRLNAKTMAGGGGHMQAGISTTSANLESKENSDSNMVSF